MNPHKAISDNNEIDLDIVLEDMNACKKEENTIKICIKDSVHMSNINKYKGKLSVEDEDDKEEDISIDRIGTNSNNFRDKRVSPLDSYNEYNKDNLSLLLELE